MNKDLIIDDILKEKASSESLSLPEDLNIIIKKTLADLPERKKKKGTFAKIATTAVVVLVITVSSLSVAFPVYARNMPIVGSVFQFLSEKNIIDREYIEYSSDLNLSKTSNDVKVTINSITYDGIELNIAYTIESKEQLKDVPHILDKEFEINGKTTSFSSSGNGEFINKNTYVGVDSFKVPHDYLPNKIRKNILGGDVEIPDNFIMDLNIKEFSGDIKGNWDFKFKISIDKIKGKVKQVKTSVDLSEIRPNLKVNEVIFTPLNTVLRTGEDSIDLNYKAEYIAFDDKGRSLLCKGSNGSGDNDEVYLQYTFRGIYDDTKAVTFIPTTYTKEYTDRMKNATESFQLDRKKTELNLNGTTILSEGRYGEYKVNKVESLEDKTFVYYECTGLLSSLSPYGLQIKDESGNIYYFETELIRDNGDNNFVAEINHLNKDIKYTLSSNDLEKIYDIREDLKFTIEVK